MLLYAVAMQAQMEAILKSSHELIKTPGMSAVMHGFYAVPGLIMCVEIGLIGEWLQQKDVEVKGFCEERGLDYEFVQSWCDYFELYGYLTQEEGRARATPVGMGIMQRWPQIMLNYSYASLNANVVPLARKEKSYGYGKEVYRDMYFDSKGAGGLGAIMSFGQIAGYLQSKNHKCLLDIGCGDGTFLVTACKMFPGLTAVGVDQSEVSLANSEKNFASNDMASRGRFFQGDIMDPDTIFANPAMNEVDIATIMQIFQEITVESTEPVKRFLASFRKHRPGVQLAVAELYRLDVADLKMYQPLGVAENMLHHHLSDQNILRREQWLEIYAEAGFEVVDNIVHVQLPGCPPVVETLVLKTV